MGRRFGKPEGGEEKTAGGFAKPEQGPRRRTSCGPRMKASRRKSLNKAAALQLDCKGEEGWKKGCPQLDPNSVLCFGSNMFLFLFRLPALVWIRLAEPADRLEVEAENRFGQELTNLYLDSAVSATKAHIILERCQVHQMAQKRHADQMRKEISSNGFARHMSGRTYTGRTFLSEIRKQSASPTITFLSCFPHA